MLRAITHAPIHWEHDAASEQEKCASPESPLNQPSPTVSQHHERCKSRGKSGDKTITSKLSPEPSSQRKTAWAERSASSASEGKVSDFVNLEWEPEDNDSRVSSLKRSNSQRSPTPAFETECDDRKRLRTPVSRCDSVQRRSPICRPQSAPHSRCNAYRDYNTPTPPSRPQSASGRSRVSLDYDKTHAATASSSVNKKNNAPFALYGGDCKPAPRKVHDIPRCLQQKYCRPVDKRIEFHKMASNKSKDSKKLVHAMKMSNLPRDFSSWVTEYKGNYKAFNPCVYKTFHI